MRGLRQALRCQPDYAAAHLNLGNVLYDQQQLEEAAASLREAVRLQPDCAEAYNSLAVVLQSQRQLEEARALYEEAGVASSLGRVLYRLAVVAWHQGDLDRAERLSRESIRTLAPLEDRGTLCEAQRRLAEVLLEKGKVDAYDPLNGTFVPLEMQVRQRLVENAEKDIEPRTEWETHI